MLGVAWGTDRDTVKARFPGLAPAAETADALSYPLEAVAARLRDEGSFCPSRIGASPERMGDELAFIFIEDRLAAGFARFGYGFEAIGQATETLSEQAMSAFARAEFHGLVFEFTARHGTAAQVTEHPMRSGNLQVLGVALFDTGPQGLVQLAFGHDGGWLVGELRYQAPIDGRGGF